MNAQGIPYNMDFYFDEQLRDRPVNAQSMAQGVAYLRAHYL
ncbi:hypothetical protein [Numidum massiliense]|nr:hypothetical protein [Numidum massiliense]